MKSTVTFADKLNPTHLCATQLEIGKTYRVVTAGNSCYNNQLATRFRNGATNVDHIIILCNAANGMPVCFPVSELRSYEFELVTGQVIVVFN